MQYCSLVLISVHIYRDAWDLRFNCSYLNTEDAVGLGLTYFQTWSHSIQFHAFHVTFILNRNLIFSEVLYCMSSWKYNPPSDRLWLNEGDVGQKVHRHISIPIPIPSVSVQRILGVSVKYAYNICILLSVISSWWDRDSNKK